MIREDYWKIVSGDPMVVKGRIVMPYRYFQGRTASHFYVELRDHQRLLGMRCDRCSMTFMPPRDMCPKCFSRLNTWREVGPAGVLETWTTASYPLRIHPIKEPITYGIIRLDGADTGLVHLVGEVERRELKIGMRVEAVFKQKREGNILDIKYFRPVETGRGGD